MALYRSQLNKPKTDRVTNRAYTSREVAEDDPEAFWLFVKQELNIV